MDTCRHPDGCAKPAKTLGWCGMHYMRIYVHGKPGPAESTRQSREGRCQHSDGCERPIQARGWCSVHYMRIRAHGEPGPVESSKRPKSGTCRHAEGCSEPVYEAGWCSVHYKRVKRLGEPGEVSRRKVRVQPERCGHPSGDCERLPASKGFCKLHYERVRVGRPVGDVLSWRESRPKICIHPDGCDRPPVAHGWCSLHYQRIAHTGDPGSVLRKSASWKPNSHGYLAMAYRDETGKKHTVLQHRVVMETMVGRSLHSWETVHHRNGFKDDNRPENLELRASRHGRGSRVSEIVDWVVAYYRGDVMRALDRTATSA